MLQTLATCVYSTRLENDALVKTLVATYSNHQVEVLCYEYGCLPIKRVVGTVRMLIT
jgi:hypothetical protein